MLIIICPQSFIVIYHCTTFLRSKSSQIPISTIKQICFSSYTTSCLGHCWNIVPLPFSFFVFFSIASCFPPRDSFIRTLSTQCQNKFFLFNHVVTWYYWPVIFFSIIVLLLFLLIFLSHHSWLSFSQYLVIFFFYNLWLLPLSLSFSFISFPLTIFLSFSHYF